MCPAIFFKVNPKECLVLFKEIVQSLYDHQNIKYPHHYNDLEFKYDCGQYFHDMTLLNDLCKYRIVLPMNFWKSNK